MVVGRPIPLPAIAHPSPSDVDLWHARYVEALKELHERHKEVHRAEYGIVSQMRIVE
jgi:hypothetical protein